MSYQDRRLSDANHRLWIAYRHDLRIRNLSAQTMLSYFNCLYAADEYFRTFGSVSRDAGSGATGERSSNRHHGGDFGSLSKLDIQAFIADSLERYSPATVHMFHVGLKVFFNWMVREEFITKSPMAAIPAPQVPDRPPRIVTDQELKALLATCSGTTFRDRRDNALIRVMLEPGGLRRAEIVSLSLDSVDLKEELITVTGKGRKVRRIAYSDKTGQALHRYLHMRQSHKYADSDRLWLGRIGPLTIFAVREILLTRCKQAGIDPIKPHALRHTAADRSMSDGFSDLNICKLFGWSGPAMLQVYARANREQRAIAESRLHALGDRL